MSNWNSYKIRFKQYLQLERSLSKNSIEAYLDDLNKLEQYSETFLKSKSPIQFKLKDLQAFVKWISEGHFTATSQARIISGIKTFYKFLLMENEMQQSPAELLESPKTTRKLPVFLSIEEIDKLVSVIDRSTPSGERNITMLETLYSCGLRVSELVGLKISDLHFNEDYIKVTGKGSKERLVPIGKTAKKLINNYLKKVRVHLPIKKKRRR